MSGKGRDGINRSNILEICRKYGFLFSEKDGGKCACTIDGTEVEIKFDAAGKLSPGRSMFLERGRKSSKGFLAEFPPESPKASPGKRPKRETPAKSRLDENFFSAYTSGELEDAFEVLANVLERKKKEEDNQRKISEIEEKFGKLVGLIGNAVDAEEVAMTLDGMIAKGGVKPPAEDGERMSVSGEKQDG